MRNQPRNPCFLVALALLGALCAACTSESDDASFKGDPSDFPTDPVAGGTGSGDSFGSGGDATPPSSSSGGNNACASVVAEANAERRPADIILAVDTSLSMITEMAAVQLNLNHFASQITASGIDVHVVLVASHDVCIPPPLGSGLCIGADTKLPGYNHVVHGVHSTNALEVLLETYPLYKASLRPNATKTFAVVTDDNAHMGAVEFMTQMLIVDPPMIPEFKFDAIATASRCPGISSNVGTVYRDLATLTAGVFGDLCLQDFTSVFNDMASEVLSGAKLACDYEIPPVPDGSTFNPAQVNVNYSSSSGAPQGFGFLAGGAAACGDLTTGWYYDDPANPKKVLLCPATCDVVQSDGSGKIDIQFGCDTVVAVPR